MHPAIGVDPFLDCRAREVLRLIRYSCHAGHHGNCKDECEVRSAFHDASTGPCALGVCTMLPIFSLSRIGSVSAYFTLLIIMSTAALMSASGEPIAPPFAGIVFLPLMALA